MAPRVATAQFRPPRRSQQERRDDTQRRLLEATLTCLGTLGYARTTTSEIVRAAGVSQGALFKYHATKAALMSAAVEYLFSELVSGYRRAFDAFPKQHATPQAAFDLLWSIYTGPRLSVAFELYMAARTDRELGRALAPVVQKHRAVLVEMGCELFPEAAARLPDFAAWVDLLMCAMEGIVVEGYGASYASSPALSVLKRLMLQALAPEAN
jgi:AcrR family transcriptional regulator